MNIQDSRASHFTSLSSDVITKVYENLSTADALNFELARNNLGKSRSFNYMRDQIRTDMLKQSQKWNANSLNRSTLQALLNDAKSLPEAWQGTAFKEIAKLSGSTDQASVDDLINALEIVPPDDRCRTVRAIANNYSYKRRLRDDDRYDKLISLVAESSTSEKALALQDLLKAIHESYMLSNTGPRGTAARSSILRIITLIPTAKSFEFRAVLHELADILKDWPVSMGMVPPIKYASIRKRLIPARQQQDINTFIVCARNSHRLAVPNNQIEYEALLKHAEILSPDYKAQLATQLAKALTEHPQPFWSERFDRLQEIHRSLNASSASAHSLLRALGTSAIALDSCLNTCKFQGLVQEIFESSHKRLKPTSSIYCMKDGNVAPLLETFSDNEEPISPRAVNRLRSSQLISIIENFSDYRRTDESVARANSWFFLLNLMRDQEFKGDSKVYLKIGEMLKLRAIAGLGLSDFTPNMFLDIVATLSSPTRLKVLKAFFSRTNGADFFDSQHANFDEQAFNRFVTLAEEVDSALADRFLIAYRSFDNVQAD